MYESLFPGSIHLCSSLWMNIWMFNVIHIPCNRLIKYCVCICLFQRIAPSNFLRMCVCIVFSIYHILWVSFYDKLQVLLFSLSTCIYFALYLSFRSLSLLRKGTELVRSTCCVCICVSLSIFRPVDHFSQNLVQVLCLQSFTQCCTCLIPTVCSNSMVNAWNGEAEVTLSGIESIYQLSWALTWLVMGREMVAARTVPVHSSVILPSQSLIVVMLIHLTLFGFEWLRQGSLC